MRDLHNNYAKTSPIEIFGNNRYELILTKFLVCRNKLKDNAYNPTSKSAAVKARIRSLRNALHLSRFASKISAFVENNPDSARAFLAFISLLDLLK